MKNRTSTSTYIPPSSPADLYKKHLDAIKSIHLDKSDSIFILGDFNISNADWLFPEDDSDEPSMFMLPINVSPLFAAEFLHGLLGYGYNQVNTIANNLNRFLKLIFCSDIDNVEVQSPRPLTKIDPYHPPLLIIHERQTDPNSAEMIQMTPRYSFARSDFIGLSNFLDQSEISVTINKRYSKRRFCCFMTF